MVFSKFYIEFYNNRRANIKRVLNNQAEQGEDQFMVAQSLF